MRIQLRQFRNKVYVDNVYIPAFLYLLSLLLFIRNPARFASDQCFYLSIAVNIANGTGIVDFAGSSWWQLRPGYTILWSAILFLIGTSPSAIVIAQSCMASVFIILVYFLGKSLYNRNVGFVASFLFAVSPETILWIGTAGEPIDYTWPSGIILSFLLLTVTSHGNNRKDIIFSVCSGLVAGFTLLVKESVVFYFIVPFIIRYIYQDKIKWTRIICFYSASLPVIVLYLCFQAYYDELSFHAMNLASGSIFKRAYSEETLLGSIKWLIQGFSAYYFTDWMGPGAIRNYDIFGTFVLLKRPLGYLVLFGFLFLMHGVIHGNKSDRVIASLLFIYIPFNIILGHCRFRFSINFFDQSMHYLVIGAMVAKVHEFICNRYKICNQHILKPKLILMITMIFMLMIFQAFNCYKRDDVFKVAQGFPQESSQNYVTGKYNVKNIYGATMLYSLLINKPLDVIFRLAPREFYERINMLNVKKGKIGVLIQKTGHMRTFCSQLFLISNGSFEIVVLDGDELKSMDIADIEFIILESAYVLNNEWANNSKRMKRIDDCDNFVLFRITKEGL